MARRLEPAQILGRLGGLKGGPARAEKLGEQGMTKASRKGWRTRREKETDEEISGKASRAATKRWAKEKRKKK